MAEASQTAPGHYAIRGELTAGSVPAVLRESADWSAEANTLSIDLSGVSRSDSAGVALLLELSRRAAKSSAKLEFSGLPDQMRAIIEFSGLREVLVDAQD